VDVAEFLNKMGAQIHGAGSPTLVIHGVEQLHGAEHTVIPDRIEAATFMTAAAITGGEVRVKGARAEHLGAVIDKFRESGSRVDRSGPDLMVKGDGPRKPADVVTMPYPGFPTDVQAQFMTLMAVTPGISVITEKIYPERFMHVAELGRLGADISLEGASAIVKGVPRLSGAPIMASDLRASAALVLAGLVAQGKTKVNRVYHIDRGYEKIDEKLRALGARIKRQKQ
jgi:UDP-N-acetylglucosamine 1-carboxyvinyltransferase